MQIIFSGELLTASQSVMGVFRQIGTVLAVALFISAFSSNLSVAKKDIWQTAQNQVAELQVSNMQKEQLLNGIKKGIDGENIPTQK